MLIVKLAINFKTPYALIGHSFEAKCTAIQILDVVNVFSFN